MMELPRTTASFELDFHRKGRRSLLVVLMGFSVIARTEVRAQNYPPSAGGLGGAHFDEPCPAGQNLTGFELRAGDDVDAIRPLCVVSSGPTQISAPAFSGGSGAGWHGGPGGSVHRLLCPASIPVILAVTVMTEGQDTRVVNEVHLYCGKAIAAAQSLSENPNAIFEGPWEMGRRLTASFDLLRCASGEIAVGIHGRAGVWLDRLGLICDAPRLSAGDARPAVSAVGRRPTSLSARPAMSICDRAADARARNSPTAPALEARCRAQTPVSPADGQPTPPTAATTASVCDMARDARARNAPTAAALEARCRSAPAISAVGRLPSSAVSGVGRLPSTAISAVGRVPSTSPAGPRLSICDRARDARGRNSPTTSGLEAQCRAAGGDPSAAPAPPPTPTNPTNPTNVPVPAAEVSPGSRVVISQIFGGGGNTEGSFSHDFIELFNAGTADQDLTDWSLQYAGASSEGAWTSIHLLSGIIKAGQYFLVQEARGANAGVELPAADAVGRLTLGSTAGKVALVNSPTLLSSSCPKGTWIDFVGYGAANCFETSPASALSNSTAAVRADVCAKKNDNSLEFTAFEPAPLNSMVPPSVCPAPP